MTEDQEPTNEENVRTALARLKVYGAASVAVVMLAMAVFGFYLLTEQHRICDTLKNYARGDAEALIAASEAQRRDKPPRTPEEQRNYDEAVADYRARVEANLEDC